jgi:hypothetical protein
MSEWKPIESAPRDGTKIIVFVPDAKYHEQVGEASWLDSYEEWRWANNSCSCCWGEMAGKPVMWQPLPPPPTGEKI